MFHYGYDDAVYTALRFLEIASATEQPVSKLTGLDFKPINTPELRYPVSEDQKVPTVNMCQAYFEEKGFNVIDIDGVRVNYDGGWALVRPSNTTPYLILRFEANDEESLERYKNEMYSLLDQLTQDI